MNSTSDRTKIEQNLIISDNSALTSIAALNRVTTYLLLFVCLCLYVFNAFAWVLAGLASLASLPREYSLHMVD